MNKLFLSVVALLLAATLPLAARQISSQEAASKAAEFFSNSSVSSRAPAIGESAMQLAHTAQTPEGNIAYYAFNRGNDGGFVIVAADDRVSTIAGYADSGSFSLTDMPENMRWWLSTYVNEMDMLYNGKIVEIHNHAKKSAPKTQMRAAVAPLLEGIMWNQGSPYNLKCPVLSSGSRAVTGCVATAYAQVMRYWSYPERGTGSFTYTDSKCGQTLSANFGATTYDWDNMLPTYGSNATDVQKSAVATLMSHVGISCSMGYGTSSGAQTVNASKALINYFGYSPSMTFLTRDYIPLNEWIEILKNEINENRPVTYSGHTPTGGHAFVFDGYDENNMFHVNWGWGGSSNGYFRVSLLNPSTQGIGSFEGGYNSSQAAGIGIRPYEEGDQDRGAAFCISTITPTINTSTISLKITSSFNRGTGVLPYLGVALISASDEIVSIKVYSTNLNAGYGWNSTSFQVNKPESIDDGIYTAKLLMMFDLDDESSWIPAYLLQPLEYPKFRVTDGKYTLVEPGNPYLEISGFNPGNVYAGMNWETGFTVKNIGDGTYFDTIAVRIADELGILDFATIPSERLDIAPGDSAKILISGTFPKIDPGSDYTAQVVTASGAVIAQKPITVRAGSTSQSILCPSWSFLNVGNDGYLDPTNLQAEVSIKNNGQYFSDNFLIFITDRSGAQVGTFGKTCQSINPNETKTFIMSGALAIAEGSYTARLYYHRMGNAANTYSAVPSATAQPIKVHSPEVPSAVETIETAEEEDIHIYNLQGLPVAGNLQPGVYIIVKNGKSEKVIIK